MNWIEENKISDQKTIEEVKVIQTYIESKRLVKRLSVEDLGIYLEVMHTHELEKAKEEGDNMLLMQK